MAEKDLSAASEYLGWDAEIKDLENRSGELTKKDQTRLNFLRGKTQEFLGSEENRKLVRELSSRKALSAPAIRLPGEVTEDAVTNISKSLAAKSAEENALGEKVTSIMKSGAEHIAKQREARAAQIEARKRASVPATAKPVIGPIAEPAPSALQQVGEEVKLALQNATNNLKTKATEVIATVGHGAEGAEAKALASQVIKEAESNPSFMKTAGKKFAEMAETAKDNKVKLALSLASGAALGLYYNAGGKPEKPEETPSISPTPVAKSSKGVSTNPPITSAADTIISKIMKKEGGLVNDPADPGGKTNLGISSTAYPKEDIENMTAERAALLYKRDYWDKIEVDKYPASVQYVVMDGAINHGVAGMSSQLRDVLVPGWHSGMKNPTKEELADLATKAIQQGRDLKAELIQRRRDFYAADAKRNPAKQKFLEGWNNRLDAIAADTGSGAPGDKGGAYTAQAARAEGSGLPSFVTPEIAPYWNKYESAAKNVTNLLAGQEVDEKGNVVFDLAKHRKVLEDAIEVEKSAVLTHLEEYRKEKDDLRKAQLFEGLGKAIANIASGLIGLKYAKQGISPGPLKFDATDWASQYASIKSDFDAQLSQDEKFRESAQKVFTLRKEEVNEKLNKAQGVMALAKTAWDEASRAEEAGKTAKEKQIDKDSDFLTKQETWLEKQADELEKGIGQFVAKAKSSGLSSAVKDKTVTIGLSGFITPENLAELVEKNTSWFAMDSTDAEEIAGKLRGELSSKVTLPDNVIAAISRMPKGTILPARIKKELIAARERHKAKGATGGQ